MSGDVNQLESRGPQLVEIEDRELVSRVLAGRTDDFRVLVERHQHVGLSIRFRVARESGGG